MYLYFFPTHVMKDLEKNVVKHRTLQEWMALNYHILKMDLFYTTHLDMSILQKLHIIHINPNS